MRRRIEIHVEAEDSCAFAEAITDACAELREHPTTSTNGSGPRWSYALESTAGRPHRDSDRTDTMPIKQRTYVDIARELIQKAYESFGTYPNPDLAAIQTRQLLAELKREWAEENG